METQLVCQTINLEHCTSQKKTKTKNNWPFKVQFWEIKQILDHFDHKDQLLCPQRWSIARILIWMETLLCKSSELYEGAGHCGKDSQKIYTTPQISP